MKKYLLIVIATLSIVPSIAFASWWNPTSWSFLHFLFQPNPQVLIINATSSDRILTDNATTTATTTISRIETTVVATSTPPVSKPIKKIVEKVTPSVKTPTPPVVEVQVQQPAQPKGTLCNGTYWNECPIGQNLICPQSGGGAYCEIQKTDQQRCESSYGLDSVYSGNKNANGGPVCGCKNGYEWNSNQTTCQLRQQSIQQPAPPQPVQAQTQPTIPQYQNIPVIIRTVIVNQPIPTAPILPTVEQQTQTCQKQHDTDVSSLTDRTQQTRNTLNSRMATAYQNRASLAERGMSFSGQAVQIGQEITEVQTELGNLIISYQTSLEGIESSLKTCLSSVVKLP